MLRALPRAEDYCKRTIRHMAGKPRTLLPDTPQNTQAHPAHTSTPTAHPGTSTAHPRNGYTASQQIQHTPTLPWHTHSTPHTQAQPHVSAHLQHNCSTHSTPRHTHSTMGILYVSPCCGCGDSVVTPLLCFEHWGYCMTPMFTTGKSTLALRLGLPLRTGLGDCRTAPLPPFLLLQACDRSHICTVVVLWLLSVSCSSRNSALHAPADALVIISPTPYLSPSQLDDCHFQ